MRQTSEAEPRRAWRRLLTSGQPALGAADWSGPSRSDLSSVPTRRWTAPGITSTLYDPITALAGL
jgi:hypothetical protein